MGRNRTRLELDAGQLSTVRRALRTSRDAREQKRLRFVLEGATGQHTLEELARLVGCSRSTLQNWLEKFSTGGLEGLMERETPPGAVSPSARPKIQKQLQAGVKVGRWKTAAEIAHWLLETHGIRRARKSIYYWLARHRE